MTPAKDVSKSGKKRKRESLNDEVGSSSIILELEHQILESRRNYNKIVTLIDYCWSQDSQNHGEEDTLAVVALCRVFCRLMALGGLSKAAGTSVNETTIVQWLVDRFNDYKDILLDALSNGDVSKQSTALTLLMRLCREEAIHLRNSDDALWRTGTFSKTLKVMIDGNLSADLRDEFVQKYVEEYDDNRFHVFSLLATHASTNHSAQALENTISMLAAIESMPETSDDLKDFFLGMPSKPKDELYALSAHKKQAQDAWLAVLRRELNQHQRKTILGVMSQRIAPWFVKVELLMDFLTDSFDEGGSTSLMALSGLFDLIRRKNLDYPQFYNKLYAMLDHNLMHSKHRSRFFRLLETFLSSTHLPAALVASFMKRISRLALNAPPAAIVVIIPLTYNLLKAHPMCTFMIHRSRPAQKEEVSEDIFQMDVTDPMETKAIDSSLWEIHTLQDHYHPNVATIANIIAQQFTKHNYNVEDFLGHSYESMLNAEFSKEIKRAPEIEYKIPKRIFTKHNTVSGQEDKLLVQLFDFA